MNGHLLARARFNAGLTPEELGKECGLSGMTIRRLEEGQRPTPRTAKKIADHFGLKPTDLWPPESVEEVAPLDEPERQPQPPTGDTT